MAGQTKFCEHCGKPLDGTKRPARRFCDRTCSAAARTPRVAKTTRIVLCAYCGKKILATFGRLNQSVSGNVYCNRVCYASSMRTLVTREQLDYWYNELGEDTEQIGRRLGINGRTVRDLMEKHGLSRRSKAEAAIEYERRPFSGDETEKAYMIGFRLGDLNVRMDMPTSQTIHIRCGTTVPAQVDLIRGLFEPYGHVNTRIGTHGETQVECSLDMSFDFLLPKEDRVPEWVTPNDPYFWAFLAGYMDAEGYIGLIRNKDRRRAVVEIASCQLGILQTLWNGLNARSLRCPDLHLKCRSGTTDNRGNHHNCDFYVLHISRKASLDTLFREIEPFLKHANKRDAMTLAWDNVRERGLPK